MTFLIQFGKFKEGKFLPGVSPQTLGKLARYFSYWNAEHVVTRSLLVTVPRDSTNNLDMGYRKVLSKEEPKVLKGTYHVVTLRHSGVTLTLSAEQVELESSKSEPDVISIISSIIHESDLYKSLTGTASFVGKPRRKGYRDIFTKKNYSVTDTNGGERHLFYMDVHGVPSFVTKQMEFVHLPGEKPRPGASDTIIDGEFVNGTFFAFDILFSHGTDVRKKTLVQRLDILFDTLMNLRMNILRMKIFYVEKSSGVYEYPGKKPTKFENLYEASKFVKETKKSNLLFTPSDYFKEPMYELSEFPKEHKLDGSLEAYFESRDKLEKLLTRIHKNLETGDMFVGTVHYSTPNSSLKLIGQKNSSGRFVVDFTKFTQIMKKWDFELFESVRKDSKLYFWFVKT